MLHAILTLAAFAAFSSANVSESSQDTGKTPSARFVAFFIMRTEKHLDPYTSNEFTCKYNQHGASYRGRISTTKSGFGCQKWALQWPHPHTFGWPHFFPDKSVEEAENYCRNPDYHQKTEGPWCFTNNPYVEWEYCDVPYCSEANCKTYNQGVTYMGELGTSQHGLKCKQWEYQESVGGYQEADFPDDTIEDASDFCRNPTNRGRGPWCYVWTMDNSDMVELDTTWEYCDVPVCPLPYSTNGGADVICKSTGAGQTYRGTVNVTKDGFDCQRWDVQMSLGHQLVHDDLFPDGSASAAENYCRNPDDTPYGPWCFTSDPETPWDYCDINHCSEFFCVGDEFKRYENSHAEGGTAEPVYDDNVDLCILACLETPDCKAVDYHHGFNPWQGHRCWLHWVTTLEVSEVDGIDIYRRDGCAAPFYDCRDTFSVTSGFHAEGGVSRNVSAVEECQQACLNEGALCIAFDWDRTQQPWMGYRCWVHLDVVTVVPEDGTNHFRRIRCLEPTTSA